MNQPDQDQIDSSVQLPAGGMGAEKLATGSASPFTISAEKTEKLDIWIDRASEWFSSIVVKEARQALKSRFFVWPFFSMLVVVLLWALGAIGIAMYDNSLNQAGPVLLCGFFDILGFPLAIIVPYATFRSLIHEFEDGTLQLVSITTLRPWQIISGKLASALLQIMVYVSILAPCIVFTYLLRGVDINQILLAIVVAITGSSCLCIFGLFLASASRNRAIGIISSLVLIASLAFVFCMWCALCYGLSFEFDSLYLNDPDVQTVLFACFACPITWALVMFAAACASVTSQTENRTTLIRVALAVQQVIFLGWVFAACTAFKYLDEEIMFSCIAVFMIHWLVIGTMMSSVPGEMTRRVRRGLPKTKFGRSFFSLFQPGPGRGFLFCLANIWSCILFMLLIFAIGPHLPVVFAMDFSRVRAEEILGFLLVMGTYITFYLSVLFLLLHAMPGVRKRSGPLFGLLIAILFFPLILLIPLIFQFSVMGGQGDYTLLQTFNCFWTTFEILNGNNGQAWIAFCFVIFSTVCLASISFYISGNQMRARAAAVPERVQQEIEANRVAGPSLPEGESIEEIFGKLPDRNPE